MNNVHATASAPSRQAERVVRVEIAFERENLRLVSRQVVSMRAPPSDPLTVAERQVGFWFQVQDVGGRPIYRRVMDNPVRFDAETPSDDPERPLRRERLESPAGTFLLLVPLSPQAHTVKLFSSPFAPAQAAQPAREVFSFPIFADVTGEPRPPEPPPDEPGPPEPPPDQPRPPDRTRGGPGPH